MSRNDDLDYRRLGVFVVLAFGLSWAVAGVVVSQGWHERSPQLLPGISLFTAVLAGGYMTMPAVAHVLTRALTREGWEDTLVRPRVRASWRYLLASWLLPVALVVAGAAVYFAVFPGRFGGLDAVAALIAEVERETGVQVPLSPSAYVAVQVLAGIALSPVLNGVFTFGEEFGWRAYLLPKLVPLGIRRALVVHGVVWGAWHWPITALGHNYGLAYPGAPWVGMLLMVVFTVSIGTIFGWLTIRGGSVWPAVIGHAVVNGFAGIGFLFVSGDPDLLLGPAPSGLVAVVPTAAFAVFLLANGSWLTPSRPFAAAAGTDVEHPRATDPASRTTTE